MTRRTRDGNPRRFDGFAEDYAFTAVRAHSHVFFLERLPARRGRALEIGCGAGALARALAIHFERVLAIDLSEPMLALARRDNPAANLDYCRMDANALALDGCFDYVVSHTAFHHLADVPRTLATLRAHVAPNGRVAIVDAVSERPSLPKWSFMLGPPREFPGDCLRHGPAAALRMLRFRLSPPWLAHLASDRYLSRATFREVFGEALPGARFENAGPFFSAVWDRA